MGRTFLFECSRCHYRATVVGGADRGFNCFVQTLVCRECASLYDVATRLKVAEPQKAGPLDARWRSLAPRAKPHVPPDAGTNLYNRLLFSATTRSRWVTLEPRCPVSKIHHVESWNDPGPCPRCRARLERTVMPYRIWD
jgi:hypothetical protein